jgi:Tfp pilus assembly protein PilV
MEVAVTMPSTSNILERLRWKVGLGLVIVAAGFAAAVAPSGHVGSDVARSSWGLRSVEPAADSESDAIDVARSSWGLRSSSEADAEVVDVARSSWGLHSSASQPDATVDADVAVDAA